MINPIGVHLNVVYYVKMSNFKMGDYHTKNHMFSIDIGSYNIVLGVKWLGTLCLVAIYFRSLSLNVTQVENTHNLHGITPSSP